MRRLQDKHSAYKGEITVFLSMIIVLLISFLGAMLEATSVSVIRSMKQANLTLAMESIFAEYDKELLQKYGILAKQGKDRFSISNRLSYYGAGNLNHDILHMELLSDHNGQEFYRQAVTYMGGAVSRVVPSIEKPYEETARQVKEQFLDLMKREPENEIPQLEQVNTSVLLALVLPRDESLSNRTVQLSELPTQRELQEGIQNTAEVDHTLSGKWLFASYLTNHFLDYTNTTHTSPLSYETEYLLAGKASDKANLEWVARRLLAIRVSVNYGFLLADEEKMAKADMIALGISTLMTVPQAKEILKQAFLFFWAYEDSLEDLKLLYQGEKVPLGNEDGGATYDDYLRALLLAADIEKLCMRALDLLELNLNLKVDDCVTGLELESTGYARGKYRYQCKTKYAYQ